MPRSVLAVLMVVLLLHEWDILAVYGVSSPIKSRYLPLKCWFGRELQQTPCLVEQGHDLLLRVYTCHQLSVINYQVIRSSKASKQDTARYYRCIYASITPLLICFTSDGVVNPEGLKSAD